MLKLEAIVGHKTQRLDFSVPAKLVAMLPVLLRPVVHTDGGKVHLDGGRTILYNPSPQSWAMELFQRGLITTRVTGGLDLTWGNAVAVAELLFRTAKREGFGRAIAAGSNAVDEGFSPPEALKYRMTIKRTMQSDPHDARILKAFALGLGVSTRGFDHLRNRVTLEINARINDAPEYKARLYGGPVSGKPNSYEGKELAVKACEDLYAVGDSVGMCRFTTKLFNSPNLPGYEQFEEQIRNAAGLEYSVEHLAAIGSNIRGIERMINHSLGVTRKDDTCPDRWFDEPVKGGPYKGERLDRKEFDAVLDRFYRLCRLNAEGVPTLEWRGGGNPVVFGVNVPVRGPQGPLPPPGRGRPIPGGDPDHGPPSPPP